MSKTKIVDTPKIPTKIELTRRDLALLDLHLELQAVFPHLHLTVLLMECQLVMVLLLI
jgi:hypothetical protein